MQEIVFGWSVSFRPWCVFVQVFFISMKMGGSGGGMVGVRYSVGFFFFYFLAVDAAIYEVSLEVDPIYQAHAYQVKELERKKLYRATHTQSRKAREVVKGCVRIEGGVSWGEV